MAHDDAYCSSLPRLAAGGDERRISAHIDNLQLERGCRTHIVLDCQRAAHRQAELPDRRDARRDVGIQVGSDGAGARLDEGVEVDFQIEVADEEDDADDLTVSVTSDIDDVLWMDPADADGAGRRCRTTMLMEAG